jgi:thiol:disulfide interchange protein DsbD
LGFLELALALKFLSVADLAYGWRILDREVFLVLWIVIFTVLGFYLLGKIRFRHDSELQHVSVMRLFLAIISFAFSIYMLPGLWGAPLKAISAFAPPLYTQDFNLYENEVHSVFNDYEEGMAYAKKIKKPVLVDFSGFGCVNCRKMEVSVWTDPQVKRLLEEQYILITLMVDDKSKLSAPLVVMEGEKKTYTEKCRRQMELSATRQVRGKCTAILRHSQQRRQTACSALRVRRRRFELYPFFVGRIEEISTVTQ